MKCSECTHEMKIKIAYNFLLECQNCGNLQKIGEKSEKVGEFEIIQTEKYKIIKVDEKSLYLPENFKEEITEEIMNFIVSLPKNLYNKNGEPVICGMSKYGFYLKYLGSYHSFNLQDLINLSPEEIDVLLDKKIKKKNLYKNKIS